MEFLSMLISFVAVIAMVFLSHKLSKLLNSIPPIVFSIFNWVAAFCLLLGGIVAFAEGHPIIGIGLVLSFVVTAWAFISHSNNKK